MAKSGAANELSAAALAPSSGKAGVRLEGVELAHANTPSEIRPRIMAGAVGAVSRTLGQFQHDMQVAKDLVASGARVVELEPADITESMLRDRIEIDPDSQTALVESIQRNGQQVPILVRQLTQSPVRYQVAFGHRRLAACRTLGRKVLAVVRPLTDEQLLIAQGQENSSRRDLSYIERAIFALNLEARGLDRPSIMAALSTDKTELSKLMSVARAVPGDIVKSIGPAPKAGRTRWLGLAERLSGKGYNAPIAALLERPDFLAATSDDRFAQIFKALAASPKKGTSQKAWTSSDGKTVVRIATSGKIMNFAVDQSKEPEFGQFLLARLSEVYEEFRSQQSGATEISLGKKRSDAEPNA
jgi:ParB family chromosome partitioning protein